MTEKQTLGCSFAVFQVANGFKVTPVPNFSRGEYHNVMDEHVFATWAEASKWLGDQFRSETQA